MTDKPKKKVRKPKRPPKLKAHITYLEMTAPLLRIPPVPTRPSVALITAKNISASFYSFLYEMVGKPHHWEDRRSMPPVEIERDINDSHCSISVLYVEGCPAGFFELDKQELPESIEIKYFGLAPKYQGLGIGKWFLSAAISNAWAFKPDSVKVETNTLDHPSALPLYQRLGFSPIGVADVEIEPWN